MITVKMELDDKDKEIIEHARQGKTAKETGAIMNISPYAVSNKIKVMMKYFKCSSKAELVDKISKLQG